MNSMDIAAEKAASLHEWFESGGAGEEFVRSYGNGIGRYNLVGEYSIRAEILSIRDFIGGLMYYEALQMEEQTGYRVDASVLLDEVVVEYSPLQMQNAASF